MPDCVTIRLSGIEDAEYKQAKIDWWDNVYGKRPVSTSRLLDLTLGITKYAIRLYRHALESFSK